MNQNGKTLSSEGTGPRQWMGRIIVAVILGEAIWALIVSVMNYLVVPWLGDVMGQSSGLPTSFTQRPYNYPELFVSILEFGIAGLVAAILNYFFQRSVPARPKSMKSSPPAAPVGPVRVLPQILTAVPTPTPSPIAAPQVAKAEPVVPSAALVSTPAIAAQQTPAPAVRPVAVVPPTPPVANPVAAQLQVPAAKVEPARPKKPKEVYYNIVGEPMPSDDE